MIGLKIPEMNSDSVDPSLLVPHEESGEFVIPSTDSKFRQQKVPACKPFLTPLLASWILAIFAVISTIMGASIYTSNDNVFEHVFDYGIRENESIVSYETIKMNITRKFTGDVYFYYQLVGYHQNHFVYASSKNWDQLKGKEPGDLSSCNPMIRDKESKYLVPCGSLAFSFFNDSFDFPQAEVKIKSIGIAQPGYLNVYGHSNVAYNDTSKYDQWLGKIVPSEQVDEHFVNWMQVAPFPTFRKLYAIIDGSTLKEGTELSINVTNNYPVLNGKFKKQIVIAQTNFLGGKNPFFGVYFIVLCALSATSAVIFLILHFLNSLPLYRIRANKNQLLASLIP